MDKVLCYACSWCCKKDTNPLIFFSLSKTQNYVPVVFISANDNQKLSKLLIKVFERSVYWNEYKTKSENKNATNEYRYFLESHFFGINKLFALIYWNRDNDVKRFKTRRYYLLLDILDLTDASQWIRT